MLPFFVLVFLPLCNLSFGQDFTPIEDIQVLSELPIEKLLSIKREFSTESQINEKNSTEDPVEGRELPKALPLEGKLKLNDRGGYGEGHGGGHYYYQENNVKNTKSSKIQSIFQISITSLAFLAFGGYLLCLLIHAINSKQNYNANNNTQMAQALATFLATKIRRIKNQNKVKKRRKYLLNRGKPNVTKVQRPNRNLKLQKKPNSTSTNGQKFSSTTKNQHNSNNKNIRRQPRPKRDVIGSIGGYIVYDDMYFSLLNLSEAYTKYHTMDFLGYNKTRDNKY